MIGVFDSGIGGVTVLKEIIKLMPNQKYIYYSDSKNNPYGDREKEELFLIVDDIVNLLMNKGCKAIVIACNTASALCVEKLRKDYPEIPIIAIEPAYKMVYDYNFNGKTLVMATKGTLESEKFLRLYYKYDNHNTILKPCIGLAELIEEGNEEKIDKYLEENLSEYNDIENVVLGCTHYPLVKKNIAKVLGNVKFFDGSVGVSKELKRRLEEKGLLTEEEFSIEFYDSSNSKEKEERFYDILNK